MADFVTLRFDRKDVVAHKLREHLFALEQMILSPSTVSEFAGRVRIAFEGYHDVGDVFFDPCVQRFVSVSFAAARLRQPGACTSHIDHVMRS